MPSQSVRVLATDQQLINFFLLSENPTCSPMTSSRRALLGVLLAIGLTGTESFGRRNKVVRTLGNVGSVSRHRSESMCFTKRTDDEEDYQIQTRNPLRLAVLRLGLTEPAATSPLNYGKYDGDFKCAYCGQMLFDSNSKYDSGSGWPSFWRSKFEGAVAYKMEMDGRLECKCKRCNSHLGHLFLDGPRPSTVDPEVLNSSPPSDPRSKSGNYLPRYCINGAALTFSKRSET